MTAKPPFKLAVAAVFLPSETLDAAAVQARLRGEYEGAKMFTPSSVEAALQSLKTVGILCSSESAFGNIVYSLTDSGKEKVLRSL